MYKPQRFTSNRKKTPFTPRFSSSDTPYHSQGYYIKGGLDVSGKILRETSDVHFDSDEDIASGSVGAASFSDPRVGYFELIDQLGVEQAQQELEKAKLKNQDTEVEKTE